MRSPEPTMMSLRSAVRQKRPLVHVAYIALLLVIAFLSYYAGKTAGFTNDAISLTAHLTQKAAAVMKESALEAGGLDPLPFYVPPAASKMRSLGLSKQPVSDKIGGASVPQAPNRQHTYDGMYSKYLEVNNQRLRKLKVLEIGLGCNMHYGPGASAWLWRAYMPNADIWFAEYDAQCLQKHMAHLKSLNVRAVSGDQGDNATLARWLEETGCTRGELFDVIIDDGGHMNQQIFYSFATLFHKALKPGGVYFIEDLQVSRTPGYRGTPGSPVMANVITDWVESIIATPVFAHLKDLQNRTVMQPAAAGYNAWKGEMQRLTDGAAYLPAYKLPTGAKSIECGAEMCAVVKCTVDDAYCPDGMGKQPFETA